jgi:hypothetical protein
MPEMDDAASDLGKTLCLAYERQQVGASISYAVRRIFEPTARMSRHGVRRWFTLLAVPIEIAVYPAATKISRLSPATASAEPAECTVTGARH